MSKVGLPTVLIVEDEPAIAETVAYALRAEGHAAEHVLLGGDALPRVRSGGIDLVVLDVGLPDMTGFDVCRALREFSDVPVISAGWSSSISARSVGARSARRPSAMFAPGTPSRITGTRLVV